MKCLLCKADMMTDDTSTYFTQLDNCYVIIENIPCKKCTQCGEVVYSDTVMDRIDEILASVQKISARILVMDYTRAA